MKKIICLMMLFASIKEASFAQELNTDKTFEVPSSFAKRRFIVDIGKGNRMQIELDNFNDIERFANMDSLIREFLKDIEPFRDSLRDELSSKRIDYISDSTSIKKIRIQQFFPKGSSYTVSRGEVSALKLEQDTVNISGRVPFIAKYTLRKGFRDVRSYRLSFFLNNLSDLSGYMDGSLNQKISKIKENVNSKWVSAGNNNMALKAEPTVTAKKPKGFVAGGDYAYLRLSVNLANYKNYFAPSFSLAAGLIISNQGFFKRDISMAWDPHFFFDKNAQGKLKTFRNDFLTLTWGQGPIRDNEPRKESSLLFIASLGYLVHREGEYIDKRTFRLGMGRLSLFEGKTKIEPMIYFNNFFKGVTPGLRLIQSF